MCYIEGHIKTVGRSLKMTLFEAIEYARQYLYSHFVVKDWVTNEELPIEAHTLENSLQVLLCDSYQRITQCEAMTKKDVILLVEAWIMGHQPVIPLRSLYGNTNAKAKAKEVPQTIQ